MSHDNRRERARRTIPTGGRRSREITDAVLGRALVAVVTAGYVLPLLVESYVSPKGFRAITEAPPPPDATLELVTLGSNVLVLLTCAAIGALRLSRLGRLRQPVVLLIAAWALGVVGLALADAPINRGVVLFPAICAAVALVRPGVATVRALGWSTLALVALSAVMALATPEAGMYLQEAERRDEKFVWAYGMLVGPYRNGNNLGLVLAVGLPAVLVLSRPWVRAAGAAATLLALALTFSRASVLAGMVGLAVWGALVLLPRMLPALRAPRLRAAVAATAVGGLGAVVLALPFVIRTPTAFNNRAGFWHEAIDAWTERPLTGWGADYYVQLARSRDNLGGFAYHAHNETAQLLVTGGVAALLLVGIAIGWAGVVAVRQAATGCAWPAAFLSALLVSAAFEVPLGIVDRGMFYPAVLVPLCLLLAHGRDLSPAAHDREVALPT